MKELIEIQSELKAPKGQYNSFGKYKYRSAEDILEAVKPLLKNHNCQLTLSDEIMLIGDRYYVKATATLTNGKEDEKVSAFAREDLDKKGMDGSQITGTASSYARKYALNGLFCIDDTKDADTDEYKNQQKNTPPAKQRTHRDELVAYCEEHGIDMTMVASAYDLNRNATEEQFEKALKELKKNESR